MWDIPVITDRTILTDQPDIVLHNKKQKTCLLIDVTIPVAQSLTQKKIKNKASTNTWRSNSAGCGKRGKNLCQL